MAALLDRIKESGSLHAIALVGAIAFVLGVPLLAYGLWRARSGAAVDGGRNRSRWDRSLHRPSHRQPRHRGRAQARRIYRMGRRPASSSWDSSLSQGHGTPVFQMRVHCSSGSVAHAATSSSTPTSHWHRGERRWNLNGAFYTEPRRPEHKCERAVLDVRLARSSVWKRCRWSDPRRWGGSYGAPREHLGDPYPAVRSS